MTQDRPDAAFARFCESGDPAALAAVFDQTASELLRVATHLVAAPDVAEDLVQSTFVTAIERREAFATGREVLPWLVGILTNLARRHRERSVRRPDPARCEQEPVTEPSELAAGRELSAAVSAAILRLPAPFQPVLRLHLRHGFTPAEIAVDLGRAPATVRKQLQRGLERLRRSLPAGVVGVATVSTRGLEAIRGEVLRQATTLQPAVLTLGGMIVMKKLIVTIAVVLLVAGAWIGIGYDPDTGADPEALVPGRELRVADGAAQDEAMKVRGENAVGTRRALAVPATRVEKPAPPDDTLTLRGIVSGVGGKPISGAAVFVTEKHDLGQGRVAVHTGAAGEFVLAGVQLDRFVAAFADGHVPCALQKVEGDPGGTQEMNFTLSPVAVVVRGRVWGPDGAPVARARIMIGEVPGAGGWHGSKRFTRPPPVWLRSDVTGRFATRSAPPGARVHVHTDGLAPWSGRLAKRERGAPRSRVPEQEIEVRLQAGAVLTGRVLDTAGRGVVGAWVYAGKWRSGLPRWHVMTVRTAESGSFRIPAIPAGTREVRVRHETLLPARAEFEFVDGGRTAWHPVLHPTLSIRGRLVDGDGAGLGGYTVRGRAANGPNVGPVKTSADGSFELTGCTQPSYLVRVYHPDDWGRFDLARHKDVVPGGAECLLRLTEEAGAVGSLSAVLQHADGRPLGRVELSLWRAPYSWGKNLHSEAGTGGVHLACLPPAEYRLDVRALDYPLFQKSFTVAPGARVDLGALRLPKAAILVVQARSADGVPIRRGFLSLVDDKQITVAGVDIFDGRGRSEPLPPGRYTLVSGSRELPRRRMVVELRPGDEKVVHFDSAVVAARRIRFIVPTKRDLVLRLVWRDGTGKQLRELEGVRWPKGLFVPETTWRFAPGVYRLEATEKKSGLRGAVEFTVRAGDREGMLTELVLK